MNIQELDILNSLAEEPFVSQRLLAERCGHSLGTVNRCVRSLVQSGCLDRDMALTEKSWDMLAAGAPQNAVILAAGSGMRGSYPFKCGDTTKNKHIEFHGIFKRKEYIDALRQASGNGEQVG